jgi:endonuclease G
MKLKTALILLSILAFSVHFASCQKDKNISLHLLLDSEQTVIAPEKKTDFLQIVTNADAQWNITMKQGGDWCSFPPNMQSGTGSAFVPLSMKENTTGEERTALISVTAGGKEASLSITQLSHAAPKPSVRIELPEIKNNRWFIEHQYYAMEYDTAQKHSVWVAYVLNATYLQKNVSRTDAWGQDPLIPEEFSSQRSDFSGYDRGHLLPSADRVFSYEANVETFYYSNMSPQIGAFNQNIWANLEAKVRTWAAASDCDTLYVVTGGAINPGIATIRKEAGQLTVPKYYYKALLKRKGNAFDGIAFWMENKSYTNTSSGNRVTHEYSMTIRELEQKTGINFFHNLPDAMENAVETIRTPEKWPL